MTWRVNSELNSKTSCESHIVDTLSRIREGTGQGKARKGSLTVQKIFMAIHGDEVYAEVRRLAIVPFIEEILRKLAEDGRVTFEIRAEQKKWFFV